MAQLGNIIEMYGKPTNICVSDASGEELMKADSLVSNGLIISAPNENGVDKGIYSLFATDAHGEAVRLSYNIIPGNGLTTDANNSDVLSMHIDSKTIIDTEKGLSVDTINLAPATPTSLGVVKYDNNFIRKNDNNQLTVDINRISDYLNINEILRQIAELYSFHNTKPDAPDVINNFDIYVGLTGENSYRTGNIDYNEPIALDDDIIVYYNNLANVDIINNQTQNRIWFITTSKGKFTIMNNTNNIKLNINNPETFNVGSSVYYAYPVFISLPSNINPIRIGSEVVTSFTIVGNGIERNFKISIPTNTYGVYALSEFGSFPQNVEKFQTNVIKRDSHCWNYRNSRGVSYFDISIDSSNDQINCTLNSFPNANTIKPAYYNYLIYAETNTVSQPISQYTKIAFNSLNDLTSDKPLTFNTLTKKHTNTSIFGELTSKGYDRIYYISDIPQDAIMVNGGKLCDGINSGVFTFMLENPINVSAQQVEKYFIVPIPYINNKSNSGDTSITVDKVLDNNNKNTLFTRNILKNATRPSNTGEDDYYGRYAAPQGIIGLPIYTFNVIHTPEWK